MNVKTSSWNKFSLRIIFFIRTLQGDEDDSSQNLATGDFHEDLANIRTISDLQKEGPCLMPCNQRSSPMKTRTSGLYVIWLAAKPSSPSSGPNMSQGSKYSQVPSTLRSMFSHKDGKKSKGRDKDCSDGPRDRMRYRKVRRGQYVGIQCYWLQTEVSQC